MIHLLCNEYMKTNREMAFFDNHKDKHKYKDKDKDKDKMTIRPDMCYIFEKDMTPVYNTYQI